MQVNDIPFLISRPDGTTALADQVWVDNLETGEKYKRGEIPQDNIVIMSGSENFDNGFMVHIFKDLVSKKAFFEALDNAN